MSAEFIVFDDLRHHGTIEIAMQEVDRAGIVPAYFTDAEEAVEAIGFLTLGVVSSVGSYSHFQKRREGITLIQAADLLEIPKAIFDDGDTATIVGDMLDPTRPDVLVPRQPYHDTESVLRTWVLSLSRAD